MKYFKRLKVFKSQQCVFDPHAMTAWSYNWWKFVECREGIVYLNNASYSMQTSCQQRIIRELLNNLCVKFQTVYVKSGLQNIDGEISKLNTEIKELQYTVKMPGTQKRANIWREERIIDLQGEVKKLRAYQKKRITAFKGRLKFSAIPGPEPLSEHEKQMRADRKAMREARKRELERPKVVLSYVAGGKAI